MNGLKVVKSGTSGFYDVFQGNGWKIHTRIRRVRTASGVTLHHINGVKLNDKTMSAVKTEIDSGNTSFSTYKKAA